MRILDRYIGRTVAAAIGVAVLALVLVFLLFDLLDELGNVGRGNYGVMQALWYVALIAPRRAYELAPMAALIGALFGLSSLISSGELTAVRAAGVPLSGVVWAVMKTGLAVMLLAALIGDRVVPYTDEAATTGRSIALASQIAMKTRNGFWARDGASYINIRTVLPGGRVQDVFIYDFDPLNRLQVATHAASAQYVDGRWVLEGIEQTVIHPDRTERRTIERAAWKPLLKPELINIVVVKPSSLSIADLVDYIGYLKRNRQDSQQYRQALWSKIVYPLSAAVMVFLAVPIVLRSPRGVPTGQRMMVGAFVGLAFHVVNQGSGHLGVVLSLSPALAVTLPTLATFAIGAWMMRTVR